MQNITILFRLAADARSGWTAGSSVLLTEGLASSGCRHKIPVHMSNNADQVIEVLRCAVDENLSSALRVMQVVHLPEAGEVWMTGDLHDHRRNFRSGRQWGGCG